MTKTRGILALIVGLVIVLVGGTWLYINVIKDEPESELTLDDLSGSEDSTADGEVTPDDDANTPPIEGEWAATGDSEVGLR